jgi:hypothetical protein
MSHMKMRLVVTGLLTTATLAFASGNTKPEGGAVTNKLMREGQWELTVTTQMEGMEGKMPPQTFTKCFAPADVKDPKDILKKLSTPECTQKEVKLEGNKVTWSMECHKNGGTQTGTGEVIYAGDTYDGTMKLKMSDPRFGERMIISHTKARRTGDCTP